LNTISPIEPQISLADQAFQKIVAAISRGDFSPGEFIKEARIAKQLGISRGPLREAMNRLEGRNLVERRPRLGVQVVSLSRRDLVELFTVREALEGMACRLAASAMNKNDIDQLSALLEEHGRSKGVRSGSGYYQGAADEDFHFRIVRGSGNERLVKALCDELYYQIRIYRYRSSVRPGRALAALEEHRMIVEALRARDPDRAEAAMRKHIATALANLVWTETEMPSSKQEAIPA
jgi:DNA-binding GntR family transcriptional regulator